MTESERNEPFVPATPTALHERAEQNIQIIRDLMESSSSFTGVSGKGYMLTGSTALAATAVAMLPETAVAWLQVWMIELLIAGALAFGFTMAKASSQGESLWSTTGRKVLFAFFPPMAAGAVLTVFLWQEGAIWALPGIWLCLYGAAVMTAGAYSVSPIPVMGGLCLGIGAVLLLFSPGGADTLLTGNLVFGLSMGGLHLLFGYWIWRDYGG